MNELAAKLLEQTPVIIVLGVCLYALWNEKKTQIKGAHDERVLHKDEITEIYTKHAKEIKELKLCIGVSEIGGGVQPCTRPHISQYPVQSLSPAFRGYNLKDCAAPLPPSSVPSPQRY